MKEQTTKTVAIKIKELTWVLVYVKQNNYFPDNKTKAGTSGMWLCKENYPWKFSIYAGKDMDEAMIYYRKYKLKGD